MNGKPPSENHPWRYAAVNKQRKTEEDDALEREDAFDKSLEDRYEDQLERIANSYGGIE